MNKISIFSTLLIASALTFSCNKKSDDPQPEVTQTTNQGPSPVVQQLYPTPTVKIGFSVEVIPTNSTTNARIEGLSGVQVTVKQNGSTYSTTTDQSGIATFSDLIEGSASIFVSKQGFLSLNTFADIKYNGTPVVAGTNGNAAAGNVTVSNQQTSSSRVLITLPRIGSTVEGVVKADVDGSGSGTSNVLSSGTIQLVLTNPNFSPSVYTTTVNNGQYSFTNLPEGVAYTLQTIDVTATEPSAGTNPSFKINLNFPGTVRTTPLVGNKAYLNIITLN